MISPAIRRQRRALLLYYIIEIGPFFFPNREKDGFCGDYGMMDISDSGEILLHRGHPYSHTTNILSMPRSSMPIGQGATNRESTSKDVSKCPGPVEKATNLANVSSLSTLDAMIANHLIIMRLKCCADQSSLHSTENLA